jgi:hypothetical protein
VPSFISPIRFAFVAAALASTLLVAPQTHADAESDAKDLFARGRDLRSKNDCAGAVPLFRKASKIYPQGLGSLRNVAECEEQIGHWASSRRAWLDLKRALIALPAPDAKYDGWDKDSDDAASRLAPKVATVFVDVIVKTPEGEGPANERSGVELLVNGESLGTNLVGTPLERDPGNYRIRVRRRRYGRATSARGRRGSLRASHGGDHRRGRGRRDDRRRDRHRDPPREREERSRVDLREHRRLPDEQEERRGEHPVARADDEHAHHGVLHRRPGAPRGRDRDRAREPEELDGQHAHPPPRPRVRRRDVEVLR